MAFGQKKSRKLAIFFKLLFEYIILDPSVIFYKNIILLI